MKRGYYPKYEVTKIETSEELDGRCFVLDFEDPVARDAAMYYARATDNEVLLRDLVHIFKKMGVWA